VLVSLSGEETLAFSGYPQDDLAYQALYQPLGISAGDYELAAVRGAPQWGDHVVCFRNGLCLLDASYERQDGDEGLLQLTWEIQEPLALPRMPLYSKPPPPGAYDGPRLRVFAQLWNAGGDFVDGDDGLWVDPLTLRVGDVFRQQHHLDMSGEANGATILFGLYDPMTGQRILTEDGRDALRLELN
jgi:hypothetical protein